MNEITQIVMDATDGRRFAAEQNILIAAGKIIRDTTESELEAIVRSTNINGPLWGAAVMAQHELTRRRVVANFVSRDRGEGVL